MSNIYLEALPDKLKVDVYFILKEYIELKKLLELSSKKFAEIDNFDLQILRALVYFEDAEPNPMPKLIKQVNWDEIKDF